LASSKKKRKILLGCANDNLNLSEVNSLLADYCLDPITSQEWLLWTTYYLSIVKNDQVFERELINNNRSLSWFANEINRRKRKQIIS